MRIKQLVSLESNTRCFAGLSAGLWSVSPNHFGAFLLLEKVENSSPFNRIRNRFTGQGVDTLDGC